MKNKILIDVYVPSLDEEYNIFIPLNKNIANIIELICKSIKEQKKIELLDYNILSFYNRDTGMIYPSDKIVRETNLKNGFRILLM